MKRFGLYIMAVILCCSALAHGQTSLDDRQKEADTRTKEASARKAEADADKAQADAANAKLGQIDPKLLPATSSVTLSDKSQTAIETQVLAYRTVNRIAAAIGPQIKAAASAGTVIVVASAELNQIRLYGPLKFQLDELTKEATRLNNPPPAPTSLDLLDCPREPSQAVPPLAVASAVIELVSLFKTDTTLTPASVTLDDFAVLAAMASNIPGSRIFADIVPDFSVTSPVLTSMATLSRFGTGLSSRSVEYRQKVAEVVAKAKDQKFKACQDLFTEDQKRLESVAARIDGTNTMIAQTLAALLKTDDQSGTRLLDGLLRAETIMDKDLMLQIRIVGAGGMAILRKNFFGGSSKFSGGAVISYLLTDKSGKAIAAGTYPAYGGSKSEKEITAEDKEVLSQDNKGKEKH